MNPPQLWIVAGPNGAGKSTLVAGKNRGRIPVVNPDEVAARGPRVSFLEAGREALRLQKEHISNGDHFIVETTFSGKRELQLMEEARAKGFKVNFVYVAIASVKQSALRVAQRVAAGGHSVPAADIRRRYERTMSNLSAGIASADRAFVLDNSEERPRLLFVKESGRFRPGRSPLPQWIQPWLDKPIRSALARGRDRSEGLSR